VRSKLANQETSHATCVLLDIVLPSDKSRAAIQSEGPQVTQAGGTNYRSTSLRQGFAGHPSAWGHDELRYYAHAIDSAIAK
jgi:hypothetical protein